MRIVKLYADWCGPCKALEHTMQELEIPHENYSVDSNEGAELVERFRVRNIPTLLKLDEDGNLLDKRTGALTPKELEEFLNEAN